MLCFSIPTIPFNPMLIIDTSTGTCLTAHTCVLVPDDALSEAEWKALDNMSDSEISEIGRQRGKPVYVRPHR